MKKKLVSGYNVSDSKKLVQLDELFLWKQKKIVVLLYYESLLVRM